MRKSRKFGVIGNSRKLSVGEVGGAGGGGFRDAEAYGVWWIRGSVGAWVVLGTLAILK